MDTTHFMATFQPLPFPLPLWLMQVLLVAGLYLHALPMNVILGGGFLCSALFLASKGERDSFAFRAARALTMALPVFISFAITQGIVPLLFVQLVYGPAFYTSSIVMAVPWLLVVFIVMASYYLSYLVIYKILKKEHDATTAFSSALYIMLMAIGFAAVGWIFTNNMTLMLSPEKWSTLYQANSSGLHMNTNEPQLIPRYLHFFIAAISVAGMTIGCFGLYMRKREKDFSDWMIKLGSRVYLAATLWQIPVGLWFLRAIPAQYAQCFLGGDLPATIVFVVSMVLTLIAIATAAMASSSASKPAFISALVTNALVILTMIVNRHQLRSFYLDERLKANLVPIQTQWDLLAIFLISTVALILYLVWLSRLVWSGYHPVKTETTLKETYGQ